MPLRLELARAAAVLAYRECHVSRARKHAMKIILWIVGIIFLIGLAVVFGLGSLIF